MKSIKDTSLKVNMVKIEIEQFSRREETTLCVNGLKIEVPTETIRLDSVFV
jgi:hypothetical protein